MPLDLSHLGEVALWRDSGDFFVPDDGVPLPPAFDDYRALPAATFAALVAEVEAARKAAPREATPVAWTIVGESDDECDAPYGDRASADRDCAIWNDEQYVGYPFHVEALVRAPGAS